MQNDQINQILKHNLRFNGSYQSMESMARDIVNTTPGATVKIPATIYKLRKAVPPAFEYQMQYRCTCCGNRSINSKECDLCQTKINPLRSDYFVNIPIKQQLNILITAAHFGKKKPNMDEFFYEFLKDIREIQNNGGLNMKHNEKEYNFMPVIIGLSCDIPAKKKVLCIVGHAGHFACNYCLHPGISHKSGADRKAYWEQ